MADLFYLCQPKDQGMAPFASCWDKSKPAPVLALVPLNHTVGVMIHVRNEQKKQERKAVPLSVPSVPKPEYPCSCLVVPNEYFISKNKICSHTYAQKGLLGSLS